MKNCNIFGIRFLFLILLLVIPLASLNAYSVDYVTTCQNLSNNNTIYELTQTILTTQTCFYVNASNVSLRGAGYYVRFNETPLVPSYILEANNVVNFSISNLTFEGVGENSSGLVFNNTNNSIIYNVSLRNFTTAIFGYRSHNNTISNLTFTNTSNQSTFFAWENSTKIYLTNISSSVLLSVVSLTNINDSTINNVRFSSYNLYKGVSVYNGLRINLSNIDAQDSIGSAILNNSNILTLTNATLGDLSVESLKNTIINNITIQNNSGALSVSSTNDTSFKFITISSGQILIKPQSNIQITNNNFTNISSTRGLTLESTPITESFTGNVKLINTSINFFNISGNGPFISIANRYGTVNFTQRINGTGNFSRDVNITSTSIIIPTISPYNQSMNISFHELSTSYGSQKLFRNSSLCFSPACILRSSNNQVTVTYTVNDSGNLSLQDIGATAPSSVTGLTAQYINTNDIYWNWTNPSDIDFNGSRVYLNAVLVANLTTDINYYNATNLTHNYSYTLTVITVDYDLYTDSPGTSSIVSTLRDTVASSAVQNLNYSLIERDLISYNWTVPTDSDVSYLVVKLNGTILYNLTNTTNNITLNGLLPNTTFNFTISTVDINGNTNDSSIINATVDDVITTFYVNRCGTITTQGVYTLSQTLIESNFTCLYLRASNVHIDGNSSSIQYAITNLSISANGIYAPNVSNFSLYNITIKTNGSTNASLMGIRLWGSSSSSIYNSNIQNGSVGLNISRTSYIVLENTTFASNNKSLVVEDLSADIDIYNITIQNSVSGIQAINAYRLDLQNSTIINVTAFAINSTSNVNFTLTHLNISLPSNSQSVFLFDSYLSKTTIQNLSVSYGSKTLSNLTGTNLYNYSLNVSNGYLTLMQKEYGSVTFPLPTILSNFSITNDIAIANNSITTNTTLNPQISVNATILLFGIDEGSTAIQIMRSGTPCTTITSPNCTQTSSNLTGPNVSFFASNLNGVFSIRGYTLRLIYPKAAEELTDDRVTFRFYVTPAYNRKLTECSIYIGSTLLYDYSENRLETDTEFSRTHIGLEDEELYTWRVTCIDNVSSTTITKTQNFTVEISGGASSGGGGSSSFGSAAGASQWLGVYARDQHELNETIWISLRTSEGVRLKVNNESHFVGILKINPTSVLVNVSSTPQIALLGLNASKTFIVDENATTRIIVTVVGIGSNVANITVSPLYITFTKNITVNDSTNISSIVNTTANITSQSTSTSNATSQQTTVKKKTNISSSKMRGTLAIITIIAIGAAVFYFSVAAANKKDNKLKEIESEPQGPGFFDSLMLEIKHKFKKADAISGPPTPQGNVATPLKYPSAPKFDDLLAEVESHTDQTQYANVQNYRDNVSPLLDAPHMEYIDSRIAQGNDLEFVKFSLIQNGYTHEQAMQAVQYYSLDKYIKGRFMSGDNVTTVRSDLSKAGWADKMLDTIFGKVITKK